MAAVSPQPESNKAANSVKQNPVIKQSAFTFYHLASSYHFIRH